MAKSKSNFQLIVPIRYSWQQWAFFFVCGLMAFLPLIIIFSGVLENFGSTPGYFLAATNVFAWLIVLALYIPRQSLKQVAQKTAAEIGIEVSAGTVEELIENVFYELKRKDKALSVDLVERKIKTKQELSHAFEQVVELAYRLLGAESAELALYDSRLRMYHSSYVVGRPFKKSAQAMLSGALQGQEQDWPIDIMVQPVAFAGTVLGSLRVSLSAGRAPSPTDRDILKVLAVQGSLAIVNGQYTHQLMRMQQVSDETQRAKTGFLANLSHEIRGPLGLMLNATELVVDGLCGDVNSEQTEMLTAVKSNGEHLLELINDVLDYAKAESGKITPSPEDIVLHELLQDIVSVVRTQAEAKGHTIELLKSEDSLAIACDRRHLRQMLINLLTNAIKYTPDGGTIKVWAERLSGQRVRINVKDSGVGIEEKDRRKVFSAFERVDNSYSLQQVGTGLGLSLTKKLAEVNGGSIDYTSETGKGSQFWLGFPAIKFDSAKHVGAAPKDPEVKGRGSELLLFETDPQESRTMRRYLESLGFVVEVAENREQAYERLTQNKPELVILDGRIFQNSENPDEQEIHDLREAAGSNFLPIVLLTSRAFSFDIERFLRVGVDVCLVRPVPLKQLSQVCRELIDGDFIGFKAPPVTKPIRSELVEMATQVKINELDKDT